MTILVASLLGSAALILLVVSRGGAAWRRGIRRLFDEMQTDSHSAISAHRRYCTNELANLPAPVRRYFAYALSPDQAVIVTARTESKGEFRIRTGGARHTFAASQFFSVWPRAFVWDAEIDVAPLVTMRVTDRYMHGEGAILAKAASVVPVANLASSRELACGELQRLLAEAVVMPTALLPSAGVTWTARDECSAIASIVDRGNTATATFHFGADGEVVRVTAMRYCEVDGAFVLRPWIGHFRDYRSVDGMMIPMTAEIAWVMPGSEMTYYRGRTTHVTFEVAA